jgi:predicted RNA-binding Zn ribbon-like protein
MSSHSPHGLSDPKPFQLVAGHVALDLVNTLDNRFLETGSEELLTSYEDLLRFTTQSDLLTERQAKKLKRADASQAERALVLTQVIELRESLAKVAYAQLDNQEIPVASLAILEEHFKQAALHRHLGADKLPLATLPLAWQWRGLGRQIAAPLWLLAEAAADLLTSDQAAQLRLCASDTCRWLFLDTSKNHTRRWCDMKICGNRMKARRFHARQTD